MDWFRSWHGAPTDNKWLLIAKRAGVTPMMVSAVFWALLDYASQQEERGSVAGFDVETYATWAGCDESDVLNILSAMRAKGVITDGDTLAAWDKRQPKREDDSAERVRRHRENRRNSVTDNDVTQCNGSVTHGNAPDTDTDIDIDPDTEADSETERDAEKNMPSGDGAPSAQSISTHASGKPKRERSDRQKEQDAWVDALAYALEFDPKIPGAYAKWVKIGNGYGHAGYLPEDVRTWKEFIWPTDWRFDKGQRPTKVAMDEKLPDIKRRREAAAKPKPPVKVSFRTDENGQTIAVLEHES